MCIIFHIPRGGGRFCRLSLPVHHPDNALKDRYPPRNEPGTGDRGKSFVENLRLDIFRMEEEKTIANFSFFILRKFPRIRGMKINFTCIFTYKILNNTISLKSYHLTVEIINHAYYENSYVTVTKNFIHSKFKTRAESESVPLHPTFREKRGIISLEIDRIDYRKKKIHESEGENIEKEVLESSSSLETARKSKYPLCGGFKKKKNVSQPDTPKRVFQKRICVLIMSLVQTVEQRDAKGVRGKLVTLITVEPSPLFLSLALFLRVSFFLLFLSSPRRASSLSLSFSHFFLFLIRGFV